MALAVCGAGGMLFTLLQLGVLSRNLDGDVFGMFVALRGLSLLLSTLMLLGLPQVLIRFLPSYQSRGMEARSAALFAASTAAVLLAGAVVVSTIGRWKGIIPGGFSAMPSDDVLLWTTLASVPLALKLLLYGGFNGQRVMHLQMYFELAYLALMTAGIVLLRRSLDPVLLFRMIFVLNAVTFVAGVPALISRIRKESAGGAGRRGGGMITPSFPAYMGASMLLSLVALAFTDFDRFLMSSALPLSAVSLFHVASRINSLIKRFLGFPVIALQPEITRIYEEGRSADLRERIVLFTKTTLIASVFLSSLAVLAGREVIIMVSGRDFAQAYRILLILLPCVPVAAFIAPLLSAMKGLHYIRWAILSDFAWMAVYFGSFFFFVSLAGVQGMALAQLCASLVQMAVVVALSRREGLYGGAGRRTGRVIVLLILFTALSAAAGRAWGLAVTLAALAASPFVLREALVRLKVFDSRESGMIKDMTGSGPGLRLASWMLG